MFKLIRWIYLLGVCNTLQRFKEYDFDIDNGVWKHTQSEIESLKNRLWGNDG